MKSLKKSMLLLIFAAAVFAVVLIALRVPISQHFNEASEPGTPAAAAAESVAAQAAKKVDAPLTGGITLVKSWDDGTRVYREGTMQLTVLPDGEVLYLPDEID